MRAVIQRVREASVVVDGEIVGRIDRGLVALVGVSATDRPADADWLADKLVDLRIFGNADGKFDASVQEVGGAVLLVSSELDEILALADRVIVMNAGRIAGELPIEQCSEQALGRLMAGAALH